MPRKSALKKNKKSTRKNSPKSTSHEIDHDFILIAGGGFVLLVLILIVLYS